MFGIGAGEFVVILIVALIVFGPGKLPEVGRAIGKGLREFRKAQAALSQTLNSIDEPEKKSPPVETPATVEKSAEKSSSVEKPVERTAIEKSVEEKISAVEKSSSAEKTAVEKNAAEKSAEEKISSAEKSSPPPVTADEVIKLAKQSPLAKENRNEKISDGHSVDAVADAERTSPAGARSSSNGVDKQP
ncbi:MAG: twin-arginine translocase TatA/TatE family subunit [Selenomonadaceae bacterium]|nr:twin-arginine translocase TatA/TatE family subunit [Selenomonadaceae bacterium]MBR4383349.1 twin-arginine translocase TatA/TatE family subunit [Selenomonadaceae bacterium]